MQHELAHVRQKHSFDVILMEIIHCLFWFNPILIFYRKAIQLNHEFLADEAVIKHFENPVSYQYLLLNKASQANSLSLTSQFNYLITKKRLIMMTKNTSPQRAFLIKLLFAPLFVGTVLMLSTRVDAQEKGIASIQSKSNLKGKSSSVKELEFTKNGVSKELIDEYENIIKRNKPNRKDGILYFSEHISMKDRDRMKTIYEMMSQKQQENSSIGLILVNVSPLSKSIPSKELFARFKNEKESGVWINEKRVKNNLLNNYKAKDFSNMYISQLEGKAKIGRTYDFQVDLMTNDFYENYRKKAIGNPTYNLTFTSKDPNELAKVIK